MGYKHNSLNIFLIKVSNAVKKSEHSPKKIMKPTTFLIIFILSCFITNAQPIINQSSLNLDGIDDEIRVPGALDLLTGSTGVTIASWAYLRNSAPAYPNFDGIVGFRNDVSADFYILQLSANQIEARFRNSNFDPPFTINHTGDFELNTWQHFALSYDGTKLRLYINGNNVDSLDASGYLAQTTSDLMAGFLYFNPTVNYALDGKIDEVGLWNRALSNEEISCIYSSQIPLQSEGLLVHLDMNEGEPDANNFTLTELLNLAGAPNASFSGLALDGTGSNFSTGINQFSNESATLCGNAFSWNGYDLNEPGTYYLALDGNENCDSLISITLTENALNTGVNQAGTTLIALQTNVSYQWINCTTMQAINGATQQTFTPTTNGSYAVVLTSGACSDTSACNTVNSLGTANENPPPFVIKPNPANTHTLIQFPTAEKRTLVLLTLNGQRILNSYSSENAMLVTRPEFCPAGIYILGIETDGFTTYQKLVFE